MRIAAWSVLSAIFVTAVLWSSTSAAMCTNPGEKNITLLKELYGYAQIAEAPKKNDLSYMENCKAENGIVLAKSPTDIVELIVPKAFTDLVARRADNSRARLQPTQSNNNGKSNSFTVGCSVMRNDRSILIDFSFKILAGVLGDRAFFYLTGTQVKGVVVLRGSGEPITIVPGTDLLRLPEIQANFKGEECVFPLIKTTVEVLCEVLRLRDSSVYEAFVDSNGVDIFSRQSQSVTMIGHSLGGSATQYVASNIPEYCNPEGDFVGFEAYAFASPGLTKQDDAQRQSESLRGYLINDDWLLQKAFSDRFQRGLVAVFTPSMSRTFFPGHFIDEVQASICLCLQGEGKLDFPVGGLSNKEMFTD